MSQRARRGSRECGAALSRLWRSPGFLLAAVASLGIGLGCTVAVAAAFRGLRGQESLILEPNRLVELDEAVGRCAGCEDLIYSSTFEQWKAAEPKSLSGLVRLEPTDAIVESGTNGVIEREHAAVVGGDFFSMLGLHAQQGRLLGPIDDSEATRAVVVTARLAARRRLTSAVGSELRIAGERFVIVGVTPGNFEYPLGTDIWVAERSWTRTEVGDRARYLALGRMRDGLGLSVVRSELSQISSAIPLPVGAPPERRFAKVEPIRLVPSSDTGASLWMLAGCVGAVLVVGCVNLCALFLTRTLAAERDNAIRAAVGADDWQLTVPATAEAFVLCGLAAAAAFVVVAFARGPIERILSWELQRPVTLVFTGGPAIVGALAPLGMAIVLSLAPLIHTTSANLSELLREGQTRTGSPRHTAFRRAVVISQIMVALLLAIAASRFASAYLATQRYRLGIDTDKVIVQPLSPRTLMGANAGQRSGVGAIGLQPYTAMLATLPEVESVTYWEEPRARFARAPENPGRPIGIGFQKVGPNFAETLGLVIVRGRAFAQDETAELRQLLVNESLADALWPGESPINRQVRVSRPGNADTTYTVVGVVRLNATLQRDWLALALSGRVTRVPIALAIASSGGGDVVLAAHTRRPQQVLPAVNTLVSRLPGDWIPGKSKTLQSFLSEPFAELHAKAWTLSALTVVAVMLAMLGVFALISETIRRRRPEFAIRMVLGATPVAMMREVLKEATVLLLIAGCLGAVVATSLGRLVSPALLRAANQTDVGAIVTNPAEPVVAAVGTAIIVASAVLLAATAAGMQLAALQPLSALRDGR